MDITGLDKAEILKVLYDNAKPLGMGFLHYTPEKMEIEEAKRLLSETTSFDYVKGRAMKVYLDSDELNTWGYNRDNGEGKAESLIETLK